MRILVLGRNGQLARSLREAATADTDVDLVAVGRPEVDLDEPATLAAAVAAQSPDLILNPAAFTAVDAAEEAPTTAFRCNAEAAGTLAMACAARGIPIVHLSTDYVFDGRTDRPYCEEDSLAPLGVYGRSKAAGELAVAQACAAHLIIRTAWVHSPYGRNFTTTMLRLGTEQDRLRVIADQRGSPTYAPHLAVFLFAAARRALSSEPPPWGTYHVTGAGSTTWHGFAEAIFATAAAFGHPTPLIDAIATHEYPTRARRPADSRLDNSKTTTIFGNSLPPWQAGVSAGVSALLGP